MTDVQVRTDFRSNPDDLLKAYERIAAEQEKMRARLEQVGRASRKAHTESEGDLRSMLPTLESVASRIGAIAAGWLSASAAIRLYNEDLRAQRELERESARLAVTTSQGVANFTSNLGDVSPAELEARKQQVRDIARDTGFSQAIMFQAASEALSSRGGIPAEAAIESLRGSGRVAAGREDALLALARGVQATSRLTGSTDAAANLGFIVEVASKSNVSGITEAAKTLIPAAAALKNFGDSPSQGAALAAALTFPTEDAEGRIVRTAAIQLGQQLNEFLPQSETGLGSTFERIQFLQANAQRRQEFLDKLSVEAQVRQPIATLLSDPNSPVARDLLRIQRELPTPTAAGPAGERLIGRIESDPLVGTAQLERAVEADVEAALLADVEAGRDGVFNRENLVRVLTGVGGTNRSYAESIYRRQAASLFGEERALGYQRFRGGLRTAATELQNLSTEGFSGEPDPNQAPQWVRNLFGAPTEEELARVRRIEELIERLDRIMERQAKAAERTADAVEEAARAKPTPVTDGGER